jgi:hypothetical protein
MKDLAKRRIQMAERLFQLMGVSSVTGPSPPCVRWVRCSLLPISEGFDSPSQRSILVLRLLSQGAALQAPCAVAALLGFRDTSAELIPKMNHDATRLLCHSSWKA